MTLSKMAYILGNILLLGIFAKTESLKFFCQEIKYRSLECVYYCRQDGMIMADTSSPHHIYILAFFLLQNGHFSKETSLPLVGIVCSNFCFKDGIHGYPPHTKCFDFNFNLYLFSELGKRQPAAKEGESTTVSRASPVLVEMFRCTQTNNQQTRTTNN